MHRNKGGVLDFCVVYDACVERKFPRFCEILSQLFLVDQVYVNLVQTSRELYWTMRWERYQLTRTHPHSYQIAEARLGCKNKAEISTTAGHARARATKCRSALLFGVVKIRQGYDEFERTLMEFHSRLKNGFAKGCVKMRLKQVAK